MVEKKTISVGLAIGPSLQLSISEKLKEVEFIKSFISINVSTTK